MIQDFPDFCLWMYVVVDDLWHELAPFFRRPGPAPVCSDSELLTMALVGECCGWDEETEMLSRWQTHRDLFPHLPTQSRFNRRRRALMGAFNLIRQSVLRSLDLARDRQCVIDRLPLPVIQFYLVPTTGGGDWQAYEATFGKVSSKKQMIFGYKLHLLITFTGLILDFELAPANQLDLEVGLELLEAHRDLQVLGDKAYVSAPKAADLWQARRIQLLALPRRNQHVQPPADVQHLFSAFRQRVETVNAQLSAQFHIEVNHAHTFWGLCTRLYTKLAAHTLCLYLNRLLEKPDFLQIKSVAFPI
jgi:hypothetical protein